jgi:uncharacterized integral membrane protein
VINRVAAVPKAGPPVFSTMESRIGSPFLCESAATRFIQALIFLIFLAAIGVFALQNRDVITVNYLTWNHSEPVALLTVVVYFVEMLSGWTVVAFVRRSFRRITEHPRH